MLSVMLGFMLFNVIMFNLQLFVYFQVFTCSFEGNCKLDAHTRKFCSGCRLKKCFDVGMKKEWILSKLTI